ncbi:hypothetical protein RJ639_003266 [Escallonia herrerae]|uniref:Uncharacterized protein n=1 Tax=Escallonia herrerae TaxID=1293975 RepID=A0AA88W0K2_9ASTE|nr:hypothetical protein RJ639_003266 [Escallonia herrerae]
MELDIQAEVLSTETVKPSSPTPSTLGTWKLSLLDQLSPPVHIPTILYYATSDADNAEKIKRMSTRLQASLSETLTHFYPLAGRIKDRSSIDCNDEGVLFSLAKININLFDFLRMPRIKSLDKFLPRVSHGVEPENATVQVAVQLNIFASGSGIAIGVYFFHKMLDAISMDAFLQCWAAIERDGDKETILQQLDFTVGSGLFPPVEAVRSAEQYLLKSHWVVKEGTVLSFIWKCAMAASGKPTKQSVLACAVNLRPRMVPPLSVYCVGNMAWQAMATSMLSDEDEREKQLSNLVCMLTAAIAKVDRDHTQGLQGVTRFRKVSSFWEEMERTYSSESLEGPVTTYVASSWCKLGFNEVDFGWGKPLWVSHSGGKFLPLVPNIILMDSGRGGDQIEAWVALGEHEMHILEHDAEFTSFATLNPSIIP